MKNNQEGFTEFIKESYQYPEELNDIKKRLTLRRKKEKGKHVLIATSMSTIAAAMLFIILVNSSTAFAKAIADIPLIGQLVEYVKFDKGLSSAIENDYVQEVNLSAWNGDNQLLIPYVLADEKHLVLFFKLSENFFQDPNELIRIVLNQMIDKTTGDVVEGFSYASPSITMDGMKQNHGYMMQKYIFSEGTVPRSLDLEFKLYKKNMYPNNMEITEDKAVQVGNEEQENEEQKFTLFKFHLELDEFKEALTYDINETHNIMGQDIMVKEITVYPTGTEVTFLYSEHNTAWIKGIETELKVNNGELMTGVSGISGSSDIDNKWSKVFIESNYFEKHSEQTLVIKAIQLLDKKEEYITIDLDNKTMTPEIKDTRLEEVKRNGDMAELLFVRSTQENYSFSMFAHEYKDVEGNIYKFRSQGTSVLDDKQETIITVKYPADGKVILQQSLTPKIQLVKEIEIKLP